MPVVVGPVAGEETDKLLVAVQIKLSAEVAVTSRLGADAGIPWVFRNEIYQQVEGTGKAALVVSRRGAWRSAEPMHTSKHPRLQVEAYADVTRDARGNPLRQDAYDKAFAVLEAADAVLHRPQGGAVTWSGVVILDIDRAGEPEITQMPGSDYTHRGTNNYNVYFA